DYNFHNDSKYRIISILYRAFFGPIILGLLLNKSNKYIYIWKTGFLYDREFEFKFLKSKNKKIVCIFVGSDIRSLVLRKKLYEDLGIDGSANYLDFPDNENEVKKVARIADKYADIIFNASCDQVSYLQSKQYYPFHYYDQKLFFRNDEKYTNDLFNKIKILHSPSNPIIKGTQLVRAAIKKLELKGYVFDYVELERVDNRVVLEHLKSSHIVLAEFYAFGLGVLTVEAMANNCAVLASSDPLIETGLPQNEDDAWFKTQAWEIYDNIKFLLDNPQKIKYFANRGYDYAQRHFSFENVNNRISTILKENGIER
ncbi:glycosyltransferase, partial [Gammaproteobacteria bacterium]|nr:glycosyltransferase [Gammaproteobacteria bacterium]